MFSTHTHTHTLRVFISFAFYAQTLQFAANAAAAWLYSVYQHVRDTNALLPFWFCVASVYFLCNVSYVAVCACVYVCKLA